MERREGRKKKEARNEVILCISLSIRDSNRADENAPAAADDEEQQQQQI